MKKVLNEVEIIRSSKVEDQIKIDNRLIFDNRLSVIEKAIMIMLLAKDDSYVFESGKFFYETGIGISNYKNAIKNLQKFGYLKKKRIQGGVEWIINEVSDDNITVGEVLDNYYKNK